MIPLKLSELAGVDRSGAITVASADNVALPLALLPAVVDELGKVVLRLRDRRARG